VDAGFLCDHAAMLGAVIKGRAVDENFNVLIPLVIHCCLISSEVAI